MMGIGFTEILIILLIVIILFGARRIPELAKGLGEGIRNFKTGIAATSGRNWKSANTGMKLSAEKKVADRLTMVKRYSPLGPALRLVTSVNRNHPEPSDRRLRRRDDAAAGASIWIASSLLDRSLGYATTGELDRLSRTLEGTVRQFYQRERESLRQDAVAGRLAPTHFGVADRRTGPTPCVRSGTAGKPSDSACPGPGGDHLDFMRKDARGVDVFSRDLGGIHMQELSAEFGRTRALVGSIESRDLRRGFTLTLLLLIAARVARFAGAARFHRAPRQPADSAADGGTDGLCGRRLGPADRARQRDDEVGRAMDAFNHMAEQLRREPRPARLPDADVELADARAKDGARTEELADADSPDRRGDARAPADRRPRVHGAGGADRRLAKSRRWSGACARSRSSRASRRSSPSRSTSTRWSRSASRCSKPAHPDTTYDLRLDADGPRAYASADLVKGILTNLLENAAEAAGPGGTVLAVTRAGRATTS